MEKDSTIYVAGHRGLVGGTLLKALEANGYDNILCRSHSELDLTRQIEVEEFFQENKIDYVFVSAAKVGGIEFNRKYQADFLYENLMIAGNVIHSAALSGVKKLLYLGSSCIYPREAPQPLKEDYLLSGPLEPTNEGYALAKISGLKLCEKYRQQYDKNFISAMPTNLYGPGDNFHPNHSHVIPGMIRKFHEAKLANSNSVVVWGTGNPQREFLFIEDLAQALVLLMDNYEDAQTINVGTGRECTIKQLAELVGEVVGFSGEIKFDSNYPDGMMRKVLDVSRINALGWQPRYSLQEGLRLAYEWALANNKLLGSS